MAAPAAHDAFMHGSDLMAPPPAVPRRGLGFAAPAGAHAAGDRGAAVAAPATFRGLVGGNVPPVSSSPDTHRTTGAIWGAGDGRAAFPSYEGPVVASPQVMNGYAHTAATPPRPGQALRRSFDDDGDMPFDLAFEDLRPANPMAAELEQRRQLEATRSPAVSGRVKRTWQASEDGDESSVGSWGSGHGSGQRMRISSSYGAGSWGAGSFTSGASPGSFPAPYSGGGVLSGPKAAAAEALVGASASSANSHGNSLLASSLGELGELSRSPVVGTSLVTPLTPPHRSDVARAVGGIRSGAVARSGASPASAQGSYLASSFGRSPASWASRSPKMLKLGSPPALPRASEKDGGSDGRNLRVRLPGGGSIGATNGFPASGSAPDGGAAHGAVPPVTPVVRVAPAYADASPASAGTQSTAAASGARAGGAAASGVKELLSPLYAPTQAPRTEAEASIISPIHRGAPQTGAGSLGDSFELDRQVSFVSAASSEDAPASAGPQAGSAGAGPFSVKSGAASSVFTSPFWAAGVPEYNGPSLVAPAGGTPGRARMGGDDDMGEGVYAARSAAPPAPPAGRYGLSPLQERIRSNLHISGVSDAV